MNAAALGRRWRAFRHRCEALADGVRERLRRPVVIEVVSARPSRLKPHRLYVTTQADGYGFGFLACPCGCGETLHLRFFGTRHPRWRLRADRRGRASVMPSIWRSSGCCSHFYLTRGRIDWCAARNEVARARA